MTLSTVRKPYERLGVFWYEPLRKELLLSVLVKLTKYLVRFLVDQHLNCAGNGPVAMKCQALQTPLGSDGYETTDALVLPSNTKPPLAISSLSL